MDRLICSESIQPLTFDRLRLHLMELTHHITERNLEDLKFLMKIPDPERIKSTPLLFEYMLKTRMISEQIGLASLREAFAAIYRFDLAELCDNYVPPNK
jgi:hypothetical protein